MFSSCLKKIEEVETANTNIFDPGYAGEQWFVYDDVYTYVNSSSQTRVKILVTVPEENAPEIQPTNIPISASINEYSTILDSASITSSGDYSLIFDLIPDGSPNYCLSMGVYLKEQDSVMNVFTECKDL